MKGLKEYKNINDILTKPVILSTNGLAYGVRNNNIKVICDLHKLIKSQQRLSLNTENTCKYSNS